MVRVHDASHAPLANAVVTGAWSAGSIPMASCTTNASGRCRVRTGPIGQRVPSVTFTVGNVTRVGFTYQPAQNHDPDGDSNGTSITVLKP